MLFGFYNYLKVEHTLLVILSSKKARTNKIHGLNIQAAGKIQ
jgi:hypothetical protein